LYDPRPVIQLDLSKVSGDQPEVISDMLLALVYNVAELMDIELQETPYPNVALNSLIQRAGKTTPVVILIDEYDTPILENLTHPKLDAIKQILRGFYKMIKANEEFIRFTFITGISALTVIVTHVGVFSALNNLRDITLNSDYAPVVGYTEKEIRHAFPKQIEQVKTKTGLTDNEFWKKLAYYYNGYSWDGEQFVYNPLSILNFLDSGGEFIPYWMQTGSPALIMIKFLQSADLKTIKFIRHFACQHQITHFKVATKRP
jgi:hypothetical protein